MGTSNEIFKPWAPVPEVVNWYRNALNRDPDIIGLQFWSDMCLRAGTEATWDAFCYSAATLGVEISMNREEASAPTDAGNNFMVVDEWFRNFGVEGDWQPYVLMMSNGVPVPDVFTKFCADYGIKGFNWMQASRLK